MNQVIFQKDNSNKIETFSNTDTVEHFGGSCWSLWGIYAILHLFAFCYAVYLSFKRHGGFDFLSFLVAFCCPWIYIIYALATKSSYCSHNCKTKLKHGYCEKPCMLMNKNRHCIETCKAKPDIE